MLIWGIYATVNTEERYVTIAYLAIILTLFAALRLPSREDAGVRLRPVAPALVLLLALLAAGESLRTVLEDRRQLSIRGYAAGWHSEKMEGAAAALQAMGVRPGDSVACVGFVACLDDPYWARLAGVRVLTEIYDPDLPVGDFLAALPNREQAIAVVRGQGAKVLVGDFDGERVSDADPFFRQWQRLDGTSFYALRLTVGR